MHINLVDKNISQNYIQKINKKCKLNPILKICLKLTIKLKGPKMNEK